MVVVRDSSPSPDSLYLIKLLPFKPALDFTILKHRKEEDFVSNTLSAFISNQYSPKAHFLQYLKYWKPLLSMGAELDMDEGHVLVEMVRKVGEDGGEWLQKVVVVMAVVDDLFRTKLP